MTLLFAYLFMALGVSFLCSLVEAALLSIPPSYVQSLAERKTRFGRALLKMKQGIDRPLAAILTLNTVAHTFGAAGVGAEATYLFGHAWIGVISVVVTVLILFVSEIIPKTIGAVHAKKLAAFTAVAVTIMIYSTYPLVIVCEWISGVISGGQVREVITRDELIAMARLSSAHGGLTKQEYTTICQLLDLRNVSVKEVMTPRLVVFALPEQLTVRETIEQHRPLRFARIPIYLETIDHKTGFVHRSQIFEAFADGRQDTTLRELAMPLGSVPELATVGQIMPQFIENNTQMFQVVDEYGGSVGIITLEDAIETMLGQEIIGETDPAVDMRAVAHRLAARRRRRKIRGDQPGENVSSQ